MLGSIVVDIFVTSKNRPELLRRCLKAIRENTSRDLYRLTLVHDGSISDPASGAAWHVGMENWDVIDQYIMHSENEGLGPSINQALAQIKTTNEWYAHQTHGDSSKVAPFVCYIQDDVIVTPGWLERMVRFFTFFENSHKIGFASGVECVEHKPKSVLALGPDGKFDGGIVLKDWIRAACMFGRREYWLSMWPIPPLDPETGKQRAKPNDGIGSGVDWWFIRDHENSVVRTGRTCLVFPGMMLHAGYGSSTWLKRDMPESEADKAALRPANYGFCTSPNGRIDGHLTFAKQGMSGEIVCAFCGHGEGEAKKPFKLPNKPTTKVECGTYGCKNEKEAWEIMCASCAADMKDDPDAYK